MNDQPTSRAATVFRPRMADPFRWLRTEVDRLFDDYGDSPRRLFDWPATGAAWPPLDLKESEDTYTLSADVAGYDHDRIDLSVEDGCVILKGDRADESERREDGLIVNERHQGRFERRVALPGRFDPAGISAKLDRGVLEITVPKIVDPAARKIQIETTR